MLSSNKLSHKVFTLVLTVVTASGLLIFTPPLARADGPGRGLTAQFEIEFMKFAIDHHFAALRMTELAAGTDSMRNTEISPSEGTSPSPTFPHTQAKASLDELKSLARRNNRVQREEIMATQRLLRQWYGINYEPRLRPQNRQAIEILERAQPGHEFNVEFMEVFSRHHYTIAQRALACLVGSELKHEDLRRMCRGILEGQVLDIDEMRNLLCQKYHICDYQPFGGLEGQHS